MVLKRLDDAVRDGDYIYGTLLGVGLNNAGAGLPLKPNPPSQLRCLGETYERIRVKPSSVQYVECHATGTPQGDQAEVDAYNQAVAQVENYAQQAGAFMAAANNTDLTASIDSYAQVNNFVVGNYTTITYTQNIDEFVINWDNDGFGSGWQGYLTEDMVSADDLFAAGEYVEQYGTMPN